MIYTEMLGETMIRHYTDNKQTALLQKETGDIYEDAVYWTGTLRSEYWIHLFVFNSNEYTDCFSGAAVGYPVRPVCK